MTNSAGRQETDVDRPAELVRLSVNLSPEVSDVLKDYAKRKGVSITEVIRRSIGVLKFVDEARNRGASLTIKENGEVKEIVFLV